VDQLFEKASDKVFCPLAISIAVVKVKMNYADSFVPEIVGLWKKTVND
jgi:hypothetical protein